MLALKSAMTYKATELHRPYTHLKSESAKACMRSGQQIFLQLAQAYRDLMKCSISLYQSLASSEDWDGLCHMGNLSLTAPRSAA